MPISAPTFEPIAVWDEDKGAIYCCLLVRRWTLFGEHYGAEKWASIKIFTNSDWLENYQYKQANLEDNCNPSTSPIVTLEYVVVNSTVVPDPCAWARI